VRVQSKSGSLLLAGLFGVLALLWLLPLLFSVTISMKETKEYISNSLIAPPRSLKYILPNLAIAWKLSELGRSFMNSLLYASVSALTAVLCAALAAYSLTKLRIKGRRFFFFIIFLGTLVPLQIYLVPLYIMYGRLNIYDTRSGLLLFYTAISIPFCLFVLHNYFTTIPNEIMEAAKLDGASSFRTFALIVLPMSIPPLISLILLQYTWVWNDLILGMILTKSVKTKPIMVSVQMLTGEVYQIGSIPQRVAAALIASLPPFVLFVVLRNYFMKGFRMMTLGR
jgi:multiple sugar transport system permease protein